MNILFPFTDFLWILQKEEYENARYLHWLKRFFFRRNFVVSEKLVYTSRAKAALLATIVLWAGSLFIFLRLFQSLFVTAIGILLWFLLIPFFVLLANLILTPALLFAHHRVRLRARELVRAHAPMRTIAVVGSYGKTTTKHFLFDLVRFHYRTQMVPGTINTTTGIAAWLIQNLSSATEVLIVEMDAYHRGGIAESMRVTPADIVIITNISEQHLERFGTHRALASTLGEAVTYARAGAAIVGDKKTLVQVRATSEERVFIEVDTSRLVYGGEEVSAPRLSASNKENLARALQVASMLRIPRSFVVDTVQHLELPDRRQKITDVYGYEGIDDSFNISLSTARAGLEAVRTLADARGKKLLVVAAGIPELGPEQKDGNEKLGRAIAATADHTAVLRTIFATQIITGLAGASHTLYSHLNDFLADTGRFPKEEWLLLLEPTLTDLYY